MSTPLGRYRGHSMVMALRRPRRQQIDEQGLNDGWARPAVVWVGSLDSY